MVVIARGKFLLTSNYPDASRFDYDEAFFVLAGDFPMDRFEFVQSRDQFRQGLLD